MSAAPAALATPARLLAAATELFARGGFHGTSIRDIAERAGANVAAGHYHYGSKERLYVEVLRAQFVQVRTTLERRGIPRGRQALRAASRRTLVLLLEARITAMLDLLLGPPPGAHGALMIREMCDPTDAIPIIVAEFIRPQVSEMVALVAHLSPRSDRETVRLAAFSIIGQVLFYRFNMPALLLLLGQQAYPPGFAHKLAKHITAFSLGGLERLAARKGKRRAG